ncbi:MAG: CoA-binding protein [Deltaproteobacteria bacterium]|nr:CoA-binding protein [Deltaproteobacteria bacterium]
MKRFFEAKTVALIGASDRATRPGYHLFSNMNAGFGERLYPVNPKLVEIEGRRCYPTILDVPSEIDLAVVFIPARSVPEALEQCAKKGISRVIIESGGFAEAGPEGVALQQKCLQIARNAEMRLWGPNCMGLINVIQKKVLSFMRSHWRDSFIPGTVSLVVQSGMLSAGFLAYVLADSPFGLSKVASIGNKVDVDETELLEYLVDDPDTGVIALYLESLERGRRFFELCRSTDKPIIALKAGRTDLGAQAARSHTASLAQNDEILDAAFRHAGVVRVYDFRELFDVARAFGAWNAPATGRKRVAVLTFSGGAAVLAADSLSDYGMQIATLSESAVAELKKVFPEWMEPANPVDLYPAIERSGPAQALQQALEAVVQDPAVDAVYIHTISGIYTEGADFERIATIARRLEKPLVLWNMGDAAMVAEIRRKLEALGIPVLDEINRGVRALAALTRGR